LLIVPRISTPATVSATLPRPQNKLMPPSITAVSTSNSNPYPYGGLRLSTGAAMSMPATDASSAETT
jgi:hypothetical protein